MKKVVDTPRSLLYKPRLVPLVAGLILAATALLPAGAQAAGEFRVRGVVLPGGAVRVAEDRYRLPDGFDASLKFYKGVYKPEKYRRSLVINQPGIKAVHVANPDEKGEWEGFNLYEYQGEVRLFVLARRSQN